MLEPIEDGNRVYNHKGLLEVQLEVPVDSSLTNNEVNRILKIASWDGGDIRNNIFSFEGGRGVMIEKEVVTLSNGVSQSGLSISGVCYVPMDKVGGIKQGFKPRNEDVRPPSTENFMELPAGRSLRTTGIKNNTMIEERESYAPCGSYIFSRLRHKIGKTMEAGRLGLTVFGVPKVEAYGRYADLKHEGENLGFFVLSIPDPSLCRVGEYVTSGAITSFNHFLSYAYNIAEELGKGLRELHEKGKVHRQPNLGNFYYDGRIQMMDWGTMVDLEGTKREQAMLRTLDIRMPHQNVEALCFYGSGEGLMQSMASITFVSLIFQHYFNDPNVNFLIHHKRLEDLTGRKVDDSESMVRLMHHKMYGDYGFNGDPKKVGRNDPCPCGSGKKYKKCCFERF